MPGLATRIALYTTLGPTITDDATWSSVLLIGTLWSKMSLLTTDKTSEYSGPLLISCRLIGPIFVGTL